MQTREETNTATDRRLGHERNLILNQEKIKFMHGLLAPMGEKNGSRARSFD